MFETEAAQVREALGQLQAAASFTEGNLIVFGCSSSEMLGSRIGTATNLLAAKAILPEILAWAREHGLFAAVQCCEHLNRCLVVEEECAREYRLEPVNTVPHIRAGGALGAASMELYRRPVAVESLRRRAHGGMDIGNTFIGMHLRRVAVCVRTGVRQIGEATVNCVRTRPILIGGERARYYPL